MEPPPSFDPRPEAQIREIEAELVDLLRRSPDDPAVREEVRQLYWRWNVQPSRALLDLVTRSADPVRFALGLVNADAGARSWGQAQILLAALAVRPDQPGLWVRAADLLQSPAWSPAFLEEASRRLKDPGSDVAVALAARMIEGQLRSGLAERAVAAYKGLPPAVRARLAEGATGPVDAEVGGLPFHAELRDLRVELAAAHLLAGDAAGAAALEASLPPPPLPPTPASPWLSNIAAEDARTRNTRLLRGLVARWLRPSAGDPFELLAETAGSYERTWDLSVLPLLGRVAGREGYPAVTAFAFRTTSRTLEAWIQRPFDPLAGLPARVIAAGRGREADLAALRQTLEEEARAAGERQAGLPKAALTAVYLQIMKPDQFAFGLDFLLAFADRAGKRAFVIYYQGPPQGPAGGQIRLEELGGSWRALTVGFWIA